ncbi:MAG: sodium:proton exchanger [Phycisphaerales bacterium]|nr:sodium:proton exchanger [Phycisphaerales bacterium]
MAPRHPGTHPGRGAARSARLCSRFDRMAADARLQCVVSPVPPMLAAASSLPLLTTIAAGFVGAWVLGIITQSIGLSPIVGYLLAGIVIGPNTPGFVGDLPAAQQLAELGVILLMFGVGLHFHVRDLWAVRRIALPGAIIQSAVATAATTAILLWFGWTPTAGVVVGMAMAVASTVVLMRVLTDRGMLASAHGHVAVGWLIVEDILTVVALVVVPMLAVDEPDAVSAAAAAVREPWWITLGWALGKLALLVAIVLLGGSRVVPWILEQAAKLRSRELFTLTVLVLSVAIAVVAGTMFGASMALGAFLAGIVVGQSPTSHQAAADALPMRDAFAVLFFVSVGMLIDPAFVAREPGLVLAGLAVVMLVKPLVAIAVVAVLGYPVRTALVVAIGLAQIGEFSFILGQVADENGLLHEGGMEMLVTVAMLSITVNPLLFRSVDRIERAIARIPWLWRLLDSRHARRAAAAGAAEPRPGDERPRAVIVGHGPVGRLVDALLTGAGFRTVVVDMNIDTVRSLARHGRPAVYGDAGRAEVLESAGIHGASHLVLTLSSPDGMAGLVRAARELDPNVEITVRARYLAEREMLLAAGANAVIVEEGEAGTAIARHVLARQGTPDEVAGRVIGAVRRLWKIGG